MMLFCEVQVKYMAFKILYKSFKVNWNVDVAKLSAIMEEGLQGCSRLKNVGRYSNSQQPFNIQSEQQ